MSKAPKKTVVVTGGAGYIGSHVCMKLAEAGFTPVVWDNFTNGTYEAVQWGEYDEINVRDENEVCNGLATHRPVAIIHLAAYIEVGESSTETERYYMNNVGGSLTMLNWATQYEIPFVFSSTCAVFGNPFNPKDRIDEYHPQEPLSPYGRTKLMVEQAIQDIVAHRPLKATVLRYFNAAGADPQGRIGECHDPETHIIPLLLDAAKNRSQFKIFGTDYDTPDGTCIRDYVHVNDLADAHVMAMKRLLNMTGSVYEHYNLGSGQGYSVRQIISKVEEVTGEKIWAHEVARRPGDPSRLIADSEKALIELGWVPRFGLDEIVRTAHNWHKNN